jgi:CRP-like cAMP-binding protein
MPVKALQALHPGERTNSSGKAVKNKLLLSVPDGEYALIRHSLEFMPMPHRLSLYEPNRKIASAYFLNQGMISLVIVTEDGRTVEASVVGKEGIGGLASTVGLTRSSMREVIQIAGEGFRISASALQTALRTAPTFRMILGRYAVVQQMHIAQTAACNRLHELGERLARWLLVTQDRVDSGWLPLTHDFLATMLGTDRPSVTLAASVLRKKNILDFTRGAVRIKNRKKLEDCACECYGVIQQFNGELGLK